ncbi:Rhodanese-like protein [Gymnopilus junonius]|uniref:Rhodanese-like protein n=1 Tax=Gymnopilus junonius TaxID=109634 RepID=A0A9P5TML1_GYMJU|nr:Rhodanese-like protein [Gymnopilus junonius]
MLRRSITRTARAVSRYNHLPAVVARTTVVSGLRLNSTKDASAEQPVRPPKTPEQIAKKAAQEALDDLQRDWDAKLIISYENFLPKTQNPSPDSYIIDVREPDEVVQGMIPSAVNLPLSVLGGALHTNPKEFLEKYGFEKPRQDQEVIFYCRSGKRSSTATDVAKRNGYTNIHNYTGSWLEWTAKQNEKIAA